MSKVGRVSAMIAVAIATAMLLHYDRMFYATLTKTGAAEAWSIVVWACAMLCILSMALTVALSRASKHADATWPLVEVIALPLLVVYARVVEGTEWEGWLLEVIYAASAIAFMAACAKVVRAAFQRRWLKATCSVIVLSLAATWTMAASAMILWFI